MAKYIVQHRRATKDVLSDKNTLIPLAGELLVELDEANSLHRLKIGDGVHNYSELSYLMAGDEILTQALPNILHITLDVDKWEVDDSFAEEIPSHVCYCQEIALEGATINSRLDLQPDVDMLAEFQSLGVVFVTKNVDGAIFVCSLGNKPTKTYNMQATLVVANVLSECDKVLGIPVGASASIEETNEKIAELEAQVASISNQLYKKIEILSFAPSPSKAEKGDSVNNLTLKWTTSKTPTAFDLTGSGEISIGNGSAQVTGEPDEFNMGNPGSWTLAVTDERDATVTKSTSIKFYDAVYFGSISADVAINDDTINRDVIPSLGKDIRGSISGSFVTTHESQRGIFICPVSYGKPQFKIGPTPLPYDWEKVNGETPLVFANAHGYTNPGGYNVWRSYRDIGAKNTNITVI